MQASSSFERASWRRRFTTATSLPTRSTRPASERQAVANGSQGGMVLLVEDEHSIGSMTRGYLERSGWRVVWVRTGEEALAELGRHQVRIVILDIRLPATRSLTASPGSSWAPTTT